MLHSTALRRDTKDCYGVVVRCVLRCPPQPSSPSKKKCRKKAQISEATVLAIKLADFDFYCQFAGGAG